MFRGWQFSIAYNERPTIARLKLIYLIPVYLITLVPMCFWFGARDIIPEGVGVIYSVIVRGRI